MDWMSFSLELVKVVLPALIVAIALIYTVQSFLKRDQQIRLLETKIQSNRDIVLNKLQAYERMALLLERMHPASVMNRVGQNTMSARELQYAFTVTLQAEYDHNVAQQIYISQEAWGLITEAKNELISLANMLGNALPQAATAAQFSKLYLDSIDKAEKPLPTETALEFLKQEVKQIL